MSAENGNGVPIDQFKMAGLVLDRCARDIFGIDTEDREVSKEQVAELFGLDFPELEYLFEMIEAVAMAMGASVKATVAVAFQMGWTLRDEQIKEHEAGSLMPNGYHDLTSYEHSDIVGQIEARHKAVLTELTDRLLELEDAVLGYFGGSYPRGTCESRDDAKTKLMAAADRALERNP